MNLLPARISRKSDKAEKPRRSPAHRAWVRGHCCMACGSSAGIECAHVRVGTDGGVGIKPSDKWTVPLCRDCHARQHQIGEESFEKQWGVNLKAVAEALFRASPHRFKLELADG
jgi:hypothetical protein